VVHIYRHGTHSQPCKWPFLPNCLLCEIHKYRCYWRRPTPDRKSYHQSLSKCSEDEIQSRISEISLRLLHPPSRWSLARDSRNHSAKNVKWFCYDDEPLTFPSRWICWKRNQYQWIHSSNRFAVIKSTNDVIWVARLGNWMDYFYEGRGYESKGRYILIEAFKTTLCSTTMKDVHRSWVCDGSGEGSCVLENTGQVLAVRHQSWNTSQKHCMFLNRVWQQVPLPVNLKCSSWGALHQMTRSTN
jgi:hypothetical protein